jgi:hypothetical protein
VTGHRGRQRVRAFFHLGGAAGDDAVDAVVDEQVRPAVLALTGPAADVDDERIVTFSEPGQHGLDVVERLEPRTLRCWVALGPSLQLARRLRAPQHHHGERRELVAIEPEGVGKDVSMLVGSALAFVRARPFWRTSSITSTTERSLYHTTGSRLGFWLHALTSALVDNG